MLFDIAELFKTLAGVRRLLIVVHDNPDPDSLASACALAYLAKTKLNIGSRICSEGIIGRAENRVLVRGLRLKLMDARRINWDRWPHAALVDSQPGTGNNSFPKRRMPLIVIDHHPLYKKTRGKYVDVRPEIGSCATMMHGYLEAAEVVPPADLATAMCYAISTDTQDLAREATPADTQAYLKLYPLADKRFLSRILHPRLKHHYYVTLARASLSAFTYGNIIGSHLGEIPNTDLVGLVADLLMQHERMGWCIVTGIWKGDLYLSLRTTPGRHRAGNVLRRALGKRGRAGGHDTLAGGRAPLKGMNADEVAALQKEIALRLVKVIKHRGDVTLRPLFPPEELVGIMPPVQAEFTTPPAASS
jgi:nanoRNase/pAp phosphatase (c-di-AMP/oligoRNAs hydrolase)